MEINKKNLLKIILMEIQLFNFILRIKFLEIKNVMINLPLIFENGTTQIEKLVYFLKKKYKTILEVSDFNNLLIRLKRNGENFDDIKNLFNFNFIEINEETDLKIKEIIFDDIFRIDKVHLEYDILNSMMKNNIFELPKKKK